MDTQQACTVPLSSTFLRDLEIGRQPKCFALRVQPHWSGGVGNHAGPRCCQPDVQQQPDHNLPVLHAKSEANRQNLTALLKWVPRGVQTLNDLKFITSASREE
ncbi:hypothetical protein NQZ68_007724 [Dissostichus eleginoides]|nr:hypothetical protein NQZ68_007724 [Dissostichus eleginoides]